MGRHTGLAPGLLLLASLCLAATASPAPAQSAQDADTIPYIFRKGDTLYTLARAYMQHRDDWRAVLQRNRIGNAYAIPPGRRIFIPTRLLKSEPLTARIIAFKGTGSQTPLAGAPAPLAKDMRIEPGAVVETGPSSFATLELSNGSRITLPSATRIRVRAMRHFLLTGSVDFDFLVEQGRVETSVTPLKGAADRYRIRTPIATAAVRGTNFRVGLDGAEGSSLTEVIEGVVGVGAGKAAEDSKAALAVERGFGASASADGRLAKEALLAPPELIEPGRVQTDPIVRLSLAPVSGARAYHVQIARDAGFVALEGEATSRTPEVSFADIPNGRWFVRVTALAHSGLEGMPQSYAMRRVLAGIAASAEQGADGWRFAWSGSGSGRRVYHFTLRPERAGAAALVDEPGLSSDAITLTDLPPGTYLWRVGLRQYEAGEEVTNWLPAQRLIVAADAGASR
ncbi:MAG: FecR domain-containing protein [Sphingobium sp.]|nr:FecR domain-containing protein [Sphingobium sp.]MBP8670565.1 FecR domain-containing protein [Sphingobium sp.]MBP9157638.1 FecR domain-containing protein [Sphingobium sp.]